MTLDFVLTSQDPTESQDRLYGEVVFWTLHHNDTTEEQDRMKQAEKKLADTGFNQWGLKLQKVGRKRYLELCKQYERNPEGWAG